MQEFGSEEVGCERGCEVEVGGVDFGRGSVGAAGSGVLEWGSVGAAGSGEGGARNGGIVRRGGVGSADGGWDVKRSSVGSADGGGNVKRGAGSAEGEETG